jgi:hypothetical protein
MIINVIKRQKEKQIGSKNAVRYALRKGKLIKMNCFICGNEKSQAHHPSLCCRYEIKCYMVMF